MTDANVEGHATPKADIQIISAYQHVPGVVNWRLIVARSTHTHTNYAETREQNFFPRTQLATIFKSCVLAAWIVSMRPPVL